MTIHIESRILNPDLFYRELAALHDGKTAEESLRINAMLILLLANQIGDLDTLLAMIDRVRAQTTTNNQ